jgi:phage/plasmid-like protein (TIGR03299 family)
MPAGITREDGMMYVGEAPWHKLGVKLDNIATASEAIEAAHLDWAVSKVDIYTEHYNRKVDGYKAIVREDTCQALAVVTDKYEPVQNLKAFDFVDELTLDPGGPKYVTAGSLWSGRRIWLLAKLPSFIQVTDRDIVDEYLLLTNSHDGSRAVEVLWTPVRVVCWNTLTSALRGIDENVRAGTAFRTRHIGNVMSRVRDAQDILGIAAENRVMLKDAISAMVAHTPTEDEITSVLEKLWPSRIPGDGQVDIDGEIRGLVPSTRVLNIRSEVRDLVTTGRGNDEDGVRGTSWALYNAITEYTDHKRSARGESGVAKESARFASSWFGSGAALKANAFTEIMDVVGRG